MMDSDIVVVVVDVAEVGTADAIAGTDIAAAAVVAEIEPEDGIGSMDQTEVVGGSTEFLDAVGSVDRLVVGIGDRMMDLSMGNTAESTVVGDRGCKAVDTVGTIVVGSNSKAEVEELNNSDTVVAESVADSHTLSLYPSLSPSRSHSHSHHTIQDSHSTPPSNPTR